MRRDAGGWLSCPGPWTRPPRLLGVPPCRRGQSQVHVLPAPRGPANSDGMPPAGVAVAKSIRHVISRSNGARDNIWMASAPRLETILSWRLHIRGIVVVGQPSLWV
jgi:hypothetical protein